MGSDDQETTSTEEFAEILQTTILDELGFRGTTRDRVVAQLKEDRRKRQEEQTT